jgi:hypothetical protein
MLFNSFAFAVFLPAVFLLYWFVFNRNLRLQNLFVLVASYVFYGWWDWRFLLLIALTRISLSRKHNVRLIFFTPPAFESYRRHLNREQLDTMTKTMCSIAGNNSNCIYMNLLSDSSFVATDYYDADHLSETGAKKLSLLMSSLSD